ncbi:Hypothetical protein PHPALM_15660 [Phytophthora palmivora]|uniref:Uncharacterized protein n=1 Tax=Phytophthora palmivora TaxID=4796 RepID=A0A2P4XRL5_9STRA|nr:Hypothetical protein PHPALM_15660 [Phytophthora palmivora]
MTEGEMLSVHNGSATPMTGTASDKFLKSKGADVSASVVSRMKQAIDEKLHGDLAESYQKLEAYFTLKGDKNPGGLTAYSISARLQFQNMFIHIEFWFFLTKHALFSTGKTKPLSVPTQSVQLSTKD